MSDSTPPSSRMMQAVKSKHARNAGWSGFLLLCAWQAYDNLDVILPIIQRLVDKL